MKIVIIFCTRPQFTKGAAISRAFASHKVNELLAHAAKLVVDRRFASHLP